MKCVVKNEDGFYLAPKLAKEQWVRFLPDCRVFNNPRAAENAVNYSGYEGLYQIRKVRLVLQEPIE